MNHLLIELAVVLVTTLLCGAIAKKLGQARVVGEIVGGIVIGPSLFGRFAPHAAAWLFPASSLTAFEVLSTVGLILFLFVIGTELNFEHLRTQKATATLASSMSILLPFALAAMVAHSLRLRFAPNNVGSLPFVLLLGVSLSITAFPVLARILEERAIQTTSLGTTALMCAAIDDVCAWTLLAIALTLIPHAQQASNLGGRPLWLIAYLAVMLLVIRPLGKLVARRSDNADLSYELLGFVTIIVLLSAAATDAIGVHPLFGAFLAGVCFPRVPRWQAAVRTRFDMVVSVILLPFFFAITGMKTRLDLLSGPRIWLWTLLILAIAIAGKVGGAVLAARLTGQGWRDAWALGALLNTRGLVELIVLNIAYNAHVFSPTLFTMLVVMALLTTMLTTPLLNWLGVADYTRQPIPERAMEAV